jgi:preprotein translocase subunit SecD
MLKHSRWQQAAILGVTAFFCLAAVPNVLPASARAALPAWAQRTVPLGFDLTGGMRMQFEVDARDVRKLKVEDLRDDVRKVLRDARIGYTGLVGRGDYVEVRIRETLDLPRALAAIGQLVRPFEGYPATTSLPRALAALDQLMGSVQGHAAAAHAQEPPTSKKGDVLASARATPGALRPQPPEYVMDVADGVIRLTVTEAALRARIVQVRNNNAEVMGRRFEFYGVKHTLRKVGEDRFVVESPVNFERMLYVIH